MTITISVTWKNQRTVASVSPAYGTETNLACIVGDTLQITGQVKKDGVGYHIKVRVKRTDRVSAYVDHACIMDTDASGNFSLAYVVNQTCFSDGEPKVDLINGAPLKKYTIETYTG